MWTGGRGGDQLDLQVELSTQLIDSRNDQSVQTEQTANVIPHPLFLLAPRSLTKPSLERAADVSFLTPQPRSFSKTPILNRRYGVNSQPALTFLTSGRFSLR